MKEDIDGLIKKLKTHYIKYNKFHNLNLSSSIFSKVLNAEKLENYHYRKVLMYTSQILNYAEIMDKKEREYIYKNLNLIRIKITEKTKEKNIKNLDFEELNYCLSQVNEIRKKKDFAFNNDNEMVIAQS